MSTENLATFRSRKFPKPRQTGFTTEQIRKAPSGALFIWPYQVSLTYAKDLARSLGRTDLVVIPLCAFNEKYFGARNVPHVVIDHACPPLSWRQIRVLEWMDEHRKSLPDHWTPEQPHRHQHSDGETPCACDFPSIWEAWPFECRNCGRLLKDRI